MLYVTSTRTLTPTLAPSWVLCTITAVNLQPGILYELKPKAEPYPRPNPDPDLTLTLSN